MIVTEMNILLMTSDREKATIRNVHDGSARASSCRRLPNTYSIHIKSCYTKCFYFYFVGGSI